MDNLLDKLANLLACYDKPGTCYFEDAKDVIEGLTREGYTIIRTSNVCDNWVECTQDMDGINSWAIVIRKTYNIALDTFTYLPHVEHGFSYLRIIDETNGRALFAKRLNIPEIK